MVASVRLSRATSTPFLGLDGLVQALVVAAAVHQAAGELIHNDDLAVLHHISPGPGA